ncbi:hypothetical protein EYF80_022557 [Liparis tanakae]|uniref:Uncharacterized protein n=1 Tax=Liparis tanakae TaxID=230148 RepID=A0A4Z2HMX3_9TELE|nr:hypothetical protein EYF80_022557 [Liparis tanakae]
MTCCWRDYQHQIGPVRKGAQEHKWQYALAFPFEDFVALAPGFITSEHKRTAGTRAARRRN